MPGAIVAKLGKTHRTKGQALIEMALILPFLLVVVGGAVDFGLAFFAGHIAQNAAREGARQLATVPTPGPGPETFGSVAACLSGASDALKWACSRIPETGLFSNFTIQSTGVTGASPNQGVTVTVSGTYTWFLLRLIRVPLPLLGFETFPEQINISRSATMRWEWQ